VEIYEATPIPRYSYPVVSSEHDWNYRAEAAHFLTSLQTGQPFVSSGEDALIDVWLSELAYATKRSGSEQRFDFLVGIQGPDLHQRLRWRFRCFQSPLFGGQNFFMVSGRETFMCRLFVCVLFRARPREKADKKIFTKKKLHSIIDRSNYATQFFDIFSLKLPIRSIYETSLFSSEEAPIP
jgi:hypothetical protein